MFPLYQEDVPKIRGFILKQNRNFQQLQLRNKLQFEENVGHSEGHRINMIKPIVAIEKETENTTLQTNTSILNCKMSLQTDLLVYLQIF